jgi:predicted transposase YdaD
VVRLWEEGPETYLSAAINLVPLTPLTKFSEDDLPALVQKMAIRINAEPPALAAKLWTATYLLMGLSYSEELVSRLMEGVANMHESTTYEAILREGRKEGRIAGEQELLVRMGTKRFGKPDAATSAAIEAIRDVERLEALGERIIDPDVRDWNTLLGAP